MTLPVCPGSYGAAAIGSDVHLVVAAGDDRMLDLHAAIDAGGLRELPRAVREACRRSTWNAFMALGPEAARQLQQAVAGWRGDHTLPQEEAAMRLPAAIGDYTDFYASVDHARNIGSLFRPGNPLLPNYAYVPVGYHGRSSSVGVSPQPVVRPSGQLPGKEGEAPTFGPSQQLDYELEVGLWVGPGNAQGQPIPIAEAEQHIFGACLLNDWSARDIQRWEYQPLGPFLGKNFATTISPWIVPWQALAPYRVARAPRPAGMPEPLPYLEDARDRAAGALDVQLEVFLATRSMREHDLAPFRLSRGNLRHLFWTPAQLIAHHTSNGCNLRAGDLLGTGTVSGPEAEARGCLLELTLGGREPVSLPSGETRSFLQDGDEVLLHAVSEAPGRPRIGWGTCRGTVCNSTGPRTS